MYGWCCANRAVVCYCFGKEDGPNEDDKRFDARACQQSSKFGFEGSHYVPQVIAMVNEGKGVEAVP